jgi:AraC family ethanolamine operon transcriptional activator
MPKNENKSQIKSSFDDFDEFSQAIQGWGLDFKQLDRGHFKSELHQIILPDILISEAHFSRNLLQRGTQPEGMRTFVIMASSATPFIWRKQEVTSNSFVIFPKDAELDAVSLPGFHVYTLSISDQKIDERLQRERKPLLHRRLKHGGVIEGAPEKVLRLRCFLEGLTTETTKDPDLLNQRNFQERLSVELTDQIFDILGFGEESCESLPFLRHARLIQDIEEWLTETGNAHCSVEELCRIFRVNERTLRRVFSEWYGVSPKQYLMALRLNAVRKDLTKSNPATSKISDIANRWGFWHMGKFAMFYRRQFGELPSETILKQLTTHTKKPNRSGESVVGQRVL